MIIQNYSSLVSDSPFALFFVSGLRLLLHRYLSFDMGGEIHFSRGNLVYQTWDYSYGTFQPKTISKPIDLSGGLLRVGISSYFGGEK